MQRPRNLLNWLLLALLVLVPAVLVGLVAKSMLAGPAGLRLAQSLVERLPAEARQELAAQLARDSDLFGPELVNASLAQMSEEDRSRVYAEVARQSPSWQDVVAEPNVGRIGMRHRTVEYREAEVRLNNVGLRSSKNYQPKPANRFRIVCLGDSMAAGDGGAEEDRFCDQLESFYQSADVRVDGQSIETYALGLGSWSMVNEGTYLASRISDYDPDVVVALTVDNDLSDTFGITGAGVATRRFSPEYRAWGTAVFTVRPPNIASDGRTALLTDLSPEARRRWTKGMTALRRIEELQERRGKHALFAVLDRNPYFTQIFFNQADRLGFRSPVVATRYNWPGEDTVLPHDPHPNRTGHGILANHLVHALSASGAVPVDASLLPALHEGLAVPPDRPGSAARLASLRSTYVERFLSTRIDFTNLRPRDLKAYLGGYFPESRAEARGHAPFASIRSAFLLARPAERPEVVELEIEVPPRDELYPFELHVSLQGQPVTEFRLEAPGESNRHLVTAQVPTLDPADEAVEVLLETSSYWTTMSDDRMKSFYLVAAEIR